MSRDTYNLVRDAWKNGTDKDKYEQWYVGNVGFLASYNGRWFDGGYAKPYIVKTPNGSKTHDGYQGSKRNLEKQASNLFNITLKCNEYKEYTPQHYKGCVFYLDPPYLNTKSYGINPIFDHEVFWGWARELSKNNYVYISELVAPKDFEIVWNRSTLVSINAQHKNTRNECLFKWKGER